MRKITLRSLFILCLIAVLAYAGDYAAWRVRVAKGDGYGTVTVQVYYAIGEKSGKTEYDFQPPQQESCAKALFPHAGLSPCWYERRHTEKEIRV
jgi:hypothetical protein